MAVAVLAGTMLSQSAHAVLAHDGSARMLLAPDRVPPGGVVEVRGEDLGADTGISLRLAGPAGGVELGSTVTDGEGHFVIAVALPTELPPATYRVQATESDGDAPLDAILIVEGAAVTEGGQPGEKDEDDPLLIALPSGWQRSLSGPIVTARPLTETLPAGSASRGSVELGLVLVAGSALLGALGLVAGSRIRRRRT
ncbi:MAG TPA: hypothetical protein VFK35_13135 [Candidatus Limnocylindrales bacterium]|nr:hypothetical protein [Candidatus Limnocylindrales bacterium]